MENFENVFKRPNFEKKIEELKKEIQNYIIQEKYDLKSLSIEELFTYDNIMDFIKIEPSFKCPSEIKQDILNIIITIFPKNK